MANCETNLSEILKNPVLPLDGQDLTGLDLRDCPLRGRSLLGTRLDRAQLDGVDLTGARLAGARLARASLLGANLEEADLTEALLEGADLAGARLIRTMLPHSRCAQASFRHALLMQVHWTGAELTRADFNNSIIVLADPAATSDLFAGAVHIPTPVTLAEFEDPATPERLGRLLAGLALGHLAEQDAETGLLELAEQAPHWYRVPRALGDLWRRRRDLHTACFYYEEALRLTEDRDLYTARALAGCLRDLGDLESSLELLLRWQEREPEDVALRRDLAFLFAQRGEYEHARRSLAVARQLAGEDVDLLIQQAELEARAGHPDRSLNLLKWAMELAPGRIELLHHVGELCARALDLPETALRALRTYVSHRPDDRSGRLLLAETLLQQDRPDEAARVLRPLDLDQGADLTPEEADQATRIRLLLADQLGQAELVLEQTDDHSPGAALMLRVRALVALARQDAALGLLTSWLSGGVESQRPGLLVEALTWYALLAGAELAQRQIERWPLGLRHQEQIRALQVLLTAMRGEERQAAALLDQARTTGQLDPVLAHVLGGGLGQAPARDSISLWLEGQLPLPSESQDPRLDALIREVLPGAGQLLGIPTDNSAELLTISPARLSTRGTPLVELATRAGGPLHLVELCCGARQRATAHHDRQAAYLELRLPGREGEFRLAAYPLCRTASFATGSASALIEAHEALLTAWDRRGPELPPAAGTLGDRVADLLRQRPALPDPLFEHRTSLFLAQRADQLEAARALLASAGSAPIGLWRPLLEARTRGTFGNTHTAATPASAASSVALGIASRALLFFPGLLRAGPTWVAHLERLVESGFRPVPGLTEGPLLVREPLVAAFQDQTRSEPIAPALLDPVAGLLVLALAHDRASLFLETATVLGPEPCWPLLFELKRMARLLEAFSRGQLQLTLTRLGKN